MTDDEKFQDLHRFMQTRRFRYLTDEQLEDIKFRLLMGEAYKSIAERYKITVAKVAEIRYRGC